MVRSNDPLVPYFVRRTTSLLTRCYVTSCSHQRIHNSDLYSWRATLQGIQDTGPRFAVGQYFRLD